MASDGSSRPSSARSRAAAEAEETRLGWRMAGLGFTVASEVAAGTLLGYLIDHLAGTAPVWTTVGAVLGILVAMWGLIRGALKLNQQLDRQLKGKPTPPPVSDEAWHQGNANEADPDDRDETTHDQCKESRDV